MPRDIKCKYCRLKLAARVIGARERERKLRFAALAVEAGALWMLLHGRTNLRQHIREGGRSVADQRARTRIADERIVNACCRAMDVTLRHDPGTIAVIRNSEFIVIVI